jgi:hypothetical protein
MKYLVKNNFFGLGKLFKAGTIVELEEKEAKQFSQLEATEEVKRKRVK